MMVKLMGTAFSFPFVVVSFLASFGHRESNPDRRLQRP